MPLVSVVTPVHNRPFYLEDAIKSIQEQTFFDWEHIIVDDGSSNPETQEILKKISAYPKTTIFRIENKGLGGARNAAIEKTSGKYILTVDDDDKWHSDFMTRAVKILESSPDVAVVTSWMKYFGDAEGIIKPMGGGELNFLISNNCTHAMYRKDCWEMAGKYEENKFFQAYTDWDLWLRITSRGYNVQVIEEPMFYYRIHKGGSMLKDSEEVHLDLFRYMIEKNRDIYSKHMIDALLLFEQKVLATRKFYEKKNPVSRLKRLVKSFLPK